MDDAEIPSDGGMTTNRSTGQLESELENVCRELSLVEGKVAELLAQQSSLCGRRDQLSVEIQARKKRRGWLIVTDRVPRAGVFRECYVADPLHFATEI